ncbi:hypothetical protein JXA84_00920 [candidate division WOR-3 bacterium]|nr:hypothetical protein [candidate division WOR-3 bacterium]
MKEKTLFLCLLFFTTSLYGDVFYVGPTRPLTALQQVVDLLDPGDSVFVDGDCTYPGDVVFTKAGRQDSKIFIIGVRINGNRPTISGGTNTVSFISPWPYDSGADHYIFQGFEITGGTSRGVYHQADDLTLRDVLVRDCPAHGILGADQGSGSCLMEFVEVRNCGDGDYRHQVYMATDEVHHPGSVFRMLHCYIHDADGGNNVKSRAERNEIYYNWIEGGFYHELELIGCDGGDTGNIGLKREDSDIVGNVIAKKATSAGNNSNFYCVRIGGDGTGMTHGRYRFVNNTFVCGTSAVFRCFDTLESVEMHNNVFYREGGGINIIRTSDAFWVHDTAVVSGSCNWVYQGASNIPSQWTSTTIGTDPGFVDFSSLDLNILQTSPLKDAGNQTPASPYGFEFPNPLFPPLFHPPLHDVSQYPAGRPSDGQIDIGAYEYHWTGVGEENSARLHQDEVFRVFYKGEVLSVLYESKGVLRLYDILGRSCGNYCLEETGKTFNVTLKLPLGVYFAVLTNARITKTISFQVLK